MSQQPFALAGINGTFAVLHEVHKRQIDQAFTLARRVHIVVNGTDIAHSSRTYLHERLQRLTGYLSSQGYEQRAIVSVYPRDCGEYDGWLHPDLECVIVTDELCDQAEQFNDHRLALGLSKYLIHKS